MIGAIDRHGPHHVAHASIKTGLLPALRRSWPNVASVTVRGLPSNSASAVVGASSVAPQRPHLGCMRLARSSIRFLVPQSGHWMMVDMLHPLSDLSWMIGHG